MARIHLGLGEEEQALAWLEKAYKERDHEFLLMHADHVFDSLHSDPRFQDLVRRIGLPQ